MYPPNTTNEMLQSEQAEVAACNPAVSRPRCSTCFCPMSRVLPMPALRNSRGLLGQREAINPSSPTHIRLLSQMAIPPLPRSVSPRTSSLICDGVVILHRVSALTLTCGASTAR